MILLFLLLSFSTIAQTCADDSDCSDANCFIPYCQIAAGQSLGVCRIAGCQNIIRGCRHYNGTCSSRKCNWSTRVCADLLNCTIDVCDTLLQECSFTQLPASCCCFEPPAQMMIRMRRAKYIMSGLYYGVVIEVNLMFTPQWKNFHDVHKRLRLGKPIY